MKEIAELILTLSACTFFGIVIFAVYMMSHSRAVKSVNMAASLVICTVISGMMLYFKFNIGIVSAIGAISFIRFREPVKDHRDLAYIFWGVVAGFLCTAHQYVALGAACMAIILAMYFAGAFAKNDRLLLVVKGSISDEQIIMEKLAEFAGDKLKLYCNNTDDHELELIYRVSSNTDGSAFGQDIKEFLYNIDGVNAVDLIYQKDDMSL